MHLAPLYYILLHRSELFSMAALPLFLLPLLLLSTYLSAAVSAEEWHGGSVRPGHVILKTCPTVARINLENLNDNVLTMTSDVPLGCRGRYLRIRTVLAYPDDNISCLWLHTDNTHTVFASCDEYRVQDWRELWMESPVPDAFGFMTIRNLGGDQCLTRHERYVIIESCRSNAFEQQWRYFRRLPGRLDLKLISRQDDPDRLHCLSRDSHVFRRSWGISEACNSEEYRQFFLIDEVHRTYDDAWSYRPKRPGQD